MLLICFCMHEHSCVLIAALRVRFLLYKCCISCLGMALRNVTGLKFVTLFLLLLLYFLLLLFFSFFFFFCQRIQPNVLFYFHSSSISIYP